MGILFLIQLYLFIMDSFKIVLAFVRCLMDLHVNIPVHVTLHNRIYE